MSNHESQQPPAGLSPEEIERIRRVLIAAVGKVCPGWLASHKDDIVQAAFLKVFRIWNQSEESIPPPTSYVWKAAYSATMDEIRRARVRREESLDEGPVATLSDSQNPQPDRQQASGELRQAIVEGLRALKPDRRQAVQLYLSGFSLRESATMLGWNTKRVDNRRYQGLADLRSFLRRRGFEP